MGQIYIIPKYIRKENEKSNTISSGTTKKIRPPRHLAQLSIWKDGVGILDIDAQLNSLKKQMDSKFFKLHQCLLEKSYAVSIKLNT